MSRLLRMVGLGLFGRNDAASMFGATALVPDTYVGSGTRINPITGATVPSGTALTVPGFAGSRALTWWGAFGGFTNANVQSTAYDTAHWTKVGTTPIAATGPTGAADAFELTQGSGGGDGITAANHTITGGSVRMVAFEVATVSGAIWLRTTSRTSGNINGTDAWVNLSTGAVGSHTANGTGTAVSLTASPLGTGWWTVRVALTYDAASTSVRTSCMLVTANNSSTRAAGVYRLRHCTCTGTAVPSPSIPTSGATASITPDAVSLSSVAQFAAGSPLLSQPWCMILGVRLEGHSIVTSHVSGTTARVFDTASAVCSLEYVVASQQTKLTTTDSSGAQGATSSTGACPDVAGIASVYANKYVPGVGLYLYRDGTQIASDTSVGAAMNPWSNPLYLGNRADLARALTGWVTSPFLITGRNVPDAEIVAMSNPALWRMVA
jgi:hypothetical protein